MVSPFRDAQRERKELWMASPIPAADIEHPDYKPSWWDDPVFEPESSTSINNLVASFRSGSGFSYPNRYEVHIFPPPKMLGAAGMQPVNAGMKKDVSIRCESISLPGRNLSSTPDSNIHGPLREVVNNANFAEHVTMRFQASSDLRERVFFENWQYVAFNPKTWNVGYYNDYAAPCSVDIYVLDRHNQRRYGLKLMECFPKSIGPTELSYATTNEIIKFSIDMNFRYWKTIIMPWPEVGRSMGAPYQTPSDWKNPDLGKSRSMGALYQTSPSKALDLTTSRGGHGAEQDHLL